MLLSFCELPNQSDADGTIYRSTQLFALVFLEKRSSSSSSTAATTSSQFDSRSLFEILVQEIETLASYQEEFAHRSLYLVVNNFSLDGLSARDSLIEVLANAKTPYLEWIT